MEAITLIKDRFDKLLEYSTTIPTGTIIGKQWKRNVLQLKKLHLVTPVLDLPKATNGTSHNFDVWRLTDCMGRPPLTLRFRQYTSLWYLGEYAEHDDPERVRIIWRKITALIRPKSKK